MRLRLGVAVSLAVLAVIFASTLWDYNREYKQGLRNVRASLEEQAHAIRLARQQLPPEAFDDYVDRFCGKMNESISPGHHILVLDSQGGVLASSHYHSGAEMESALRVSGGQEAEIRVGRHRAAQFRLKDKDGAVIIMAQYLDHVQQVLRQQLIGRLITAAVAAGALILLVIGTMNRWVLRPLGFLRQAAAAWARRDFAAQAVLAGPNDVRSLAAQFNALATELGQHEQDRQAEIDRARRIQENLLPRRIPSVPGLHVAAAYRPAQHVAGDLYDIVLLDERRAAVAILDVSGHGISAALLTGVVKMSLYHRLMRELDLAQAVSLVNSDLLGCLSDGQFVTLCVGIWDTRARTWTYCAAGHPGGIVRHGGRATHLESTGPLLGVLEQEGRWHSRSVALEPGDILLLYSDGATEAGAPDNEIGQEGLERLLLGLEGPLADLPTAILAEVRRREPGAAQDDVTIVALAVDEQVLMGASAPAR